MKTEKISLNKVDIWRVLEISVELEQPQDKSRKKKQGKHFLKRKKKRKMWNG
jgi:hypothetical protein